MRTRVAAERRRLDLRAFDQVLGAFLEDMRGRDYSASSLKRVRHTLPLFFRFLRKQRVRDLRAVTEDHAFEYARVLAENGAATTGKPYSLPTQTAYLLTLKNLFRFLTRRGAILRDPTLDVVLPTWSKLPRVVPTQDQVKKLITVTAPNSTLGKRDRALLELLYGSGIRVGECVQLDLRDLHLAEGTLFVRQGKGRKDRVVPVAGRAAAALEAYLRDSRPALVRDPVEQAVFLNQLGGRLQRSLIQAMVRAQVAAAGIPLHITPHSLRHGCATHMLQRGADVRHVQKLLGHSQVQTTALYTRVAIGDLKQMVARAHPRARWKARKPPKG